MPLWPRLFGSGDGGAPAPPSPIDDFWYTTAGRRTAAGVHVTLDSALRVPVVLDCLTVLSETIASLPFAVFERRGKDRRKAENHPLMSLLRTPDRESTTHEWIAQLVWDLAATSNAIHEVRPGRIGPIGELPRLDPAMTQVERLPDGSRRWTVTTESGRQRRLVEGEVWHPRAVPLIDGLVGMSRIAAGAEAIAAALVLQEFATNYFENDATPQVFLSHPGHFADQASRTNFLTAIGRFFGRRRKGPAVLEHGMEPHTISNNPEESQFLETRKELQLEIARIWRMPPHKVGILDRATFSNIEHQALEFVTDTLTPWIDLIEGAVNRFLVLNPTRYFFEFNVAGLLRGDVKARFDAYAQARQWGWLSVNEIRRLENLNPIGPRGDQYMQPMNMTDAGSSGAGGKEPKAAVLDGFGRPVSVMDRGEWRASDAA